MEPKTLPPVLAEINSPIFFQSAALGTEDCRSHLTLSGFEGFKDLHANPIEANEDCAQNTKTTYNFPANFSKRISHVMLFGVYHTKNSRKH